MRKMMLVATVILSFLAVASCSKEDSSSLSNDKIVGTWDLDYAEVTMMGETIRVSRDEIYSMARNMTGADEVILLDATLVITTTTINGEKYKLDGKRLIQIGDTDLSSFKITFENITDQQLTLRYDFNGMIEDIIYKRR